MIQPDIKTDDDNRVVYPIDPNQLVLEISPSGEASSYHFEDCFSGAAALCGPEYEYIIKEIAEGRLTPIGPWAFKRNEVPEFPKIDLKTFGRAPAEDD